MLPGLLTLAVVGVAGAANTFARAAEVDGTIDISGLASGQIYIPHGTFINQWTLTLTMSGPGQPDIVAIDSLESCRARAERRKSTVIGGLPRVICRPISIL